MTRAGAAKAGRKGGGFVRDTANSKIKSEPTPKEQLQAEKELLAARI